MCDFQRLRQIVLNLLDNARKYSAAGGIVRLSFLTECEDTIIVVSDAGCGIDQRDQDKIFDKFYQTKEACSKQGMGLGLPLVRHLCMMHGGSVSISSDGQGIFVNLW